MGHLVRFSGSSGIDGVHSFKSMGIIVRGQSLGQGGILGYGKEGVHYPNGGFSDFPRIPHIRSTIPGRGVAIF